MPSPLSYFTIEFVLGCKVLFMWMSMELEEDDDEQWFTMETWGMLGSILVENNCKHGGYKVGRAIIVQKNHV